MFYVGPHDFLRGGPAFLFYRINFNYVSCQRWGIRPDKIKKSMQLHSDNTKQFYDQSFKHALGMELTGFYLVNL